MRSQDPAAPTRELDSSRVLRSPSQRFARLMHRLKARYRRKERTKVDCLGALIPPGGVIFDVGANMGYLSKEFVRLHDHSCLVYCFEPLRYNYTILEKVVGRCSNARLARMALSNAGGTTDIYLPVKAGGRIGPGLAHFGAEPERRYVVEAVPTLTLDHFVATRGVPRLDFIKCDVEGAELLVFEGGRESIARFRPGVFCEIDADYTARLGIQAAAVFEFFAGHGYRSFRPDFATGSRQPCAGYSGPGDYLFLP